MKRIKVLAVMFCLMIANVSYAGNAKVLSTNAVDVTYDMQSNLYVVMDVKIEIGNVGKDECGVMMILDNQALANPMSFDKFLDLINYCCYGEAIIPLTRSTAARRTIRVTIPLEEKKLTGDGETFYAKAFIYNTKLKRCVGEGVPVQFDVNFNEIKKRMMNDAVDIVGGALLLAPFLW